MNRQELLALTPARYLAHGYRDEKGLARAELGTLWAAAAVEQLRAAGVSAAMLDPVVARATAKGSAAPGGSAPEAAFVRACREQVHGAADLPAFAQHLAAVLRLLALEESTQAFNQAASAPPARR
jgi:hypothetical protein